MGMEIEANQTETPELSEHEQAMVDVAEGNEAKAQEEVKTDEEKLLAGKYKSVEDLEKAYGELQSKLGKPTEEKVEEKVEEVTTNDEAKETVEAKGLDFDSIYNEFVDKGELTTETYDSLEKSGLSKEVVDNYIKGQEAIQQQSINQLQAEVGGEQTYQDMLQWAANSLTESEQSAFNSTLNDEASARFAIQGLYARYKSANPSLIGGDRTSGTGVSSGCFTTKSEMMKAMGSKEYKVDATYRADVQRKVALSNFL